MRIDRKALVSRHSPVLDHHDPFSPLSIGNGEIAFTADITGFQTFNVENEEAVPLCTMAQWGFHNYPGMEDREKAYSRLKLKSFVSGSRRVEYMSDPGGQEDLFVDLRINPHRANLFRLSLVESKSRTDVSGKQKLVSELELSCCNGFHQKLDLWEGLLSSELLYKDGRISSTACCHPERDLLSYRIRSRLLSEGRLGLNLTFPYPSHEKDGSDWRSIQTHSSILKQTDTSCNYLIERCIDDLRYNLFIHIDGNGSLEQIDIHSFLIMAEEEELGFSFKFQHSVVVSKSKQVWSPVFGDECRQAAATHWRMFWSESAAIELKGSMNPRALELERRIILSRYLTAIQCCGSLPPQETGLTCNSWYGKFHLEMHFWHAAFFPLWRNPEMLEKSMGYYRNIARKAKERAAMQGYKGLRWPKMTDPEGYDSPSEIGPFLCWQQPHFIIMAELLYYAGGGEELLENYADLVYETAEFIVDYSLYNPETDTYNLGPPLIPAQENHAPEETVNPVFELEYWKLGLDIAAEWQTRVGKKVPEKWSRVREKLAIPPVDGVLNGYASHQNCDDTYGLYAGDHPSFLIAYSFFSGSGIDPEKMSRSLDLVLEHWNINSMWGWDFPVMAMCAARLGRIDDAMNLLLMDADKNTYRANGHNAQRLKSDLPLYLPGNGALLMAVAMIAGGWKGREDTENSFSANGSWIVRSEGFLPIPF